MIEITSAEYRRLMDQPEAGSLPNELDLSVVKVGTYKRGFDIRKYGNEATAPKGKQKYGAVRTTVDGITFASKAEASRYVDLKRLHEAGEIIDLELQPKFPIIINCVKVCTYIADFRYRIDELGLSWEVVEDCKGMKTPVYRLKKKLMKAIYGIDIKETS